MVLSFFSGLCIERNLKSGKASSTRKIEKLYDSPSQSLIERLALKSACRKRVAQLPDDGQSGK
jgi:hypothetical protein